MRKLLAKEAMKLLIEDRIKIAHDAFLSLTTNCTRSSELINNASTCTLVGLLFLAGSKYQLVEKEFSSRTSIGSYESMVASFLKNYFPEDDAAHLMVVATYKEKNITSYKRTVTSHANCYKIAITELGLSSMFLRTPKEGAEYMLRTMIQYGANWVRFVL